MMNEKFDKVEQGVTDMVEKIREDYFSYLSDAKILTVYSLKKMSHGGKIVLGKIMKTNDMDKFLSQWDVPDGYDYIIILDKICWEAVTDADRERIIRHELCHAAVKDKDDGIDWVLRDHEITDFYIEVQRNQDDPEWRSRVASLTDAIYDQMKDKEDAPKKRKRL
jgi:hypothetical protein